MTHAFPEPSVRLISSVVENWREATVFNTERKYDLAMGVLKKSQQYGFLDHLRTGNYAPWPHETIDLKIPTDNCTTVIPLTYLFLEAHGIPAQIVQFINFKKIGPKDDGSEKTYDSHFGLIIDLGRKHRYLFDPFWKILGPILERKKHSMRIGKQSTSEGCTRKYQQLLRYTPQEFAAMMDRMHEPGASLDMLVAGQKVYEDRRMHPYKADMMVWYDDESNTLTSRMYIPQVGFPNKAIYCRMEMDDQGDIQNTTLELVVAKDATWKKLINETTIAKTDHATLRKVRRLLKGVSRHGKRLGPALLQNGENGEQLTALSGSIVQTLTHGQRAALFNAIAGRTIYEYTNPDQEYLSTAERRDADLHQWLAEYYQKEDEKEVPRREWYRHSVHLVPKSRKEAEQLHRRVKKLEEERDQHDREYDTWINLRCADPKAYALIRDKFLFGQSLHDQKRDALDARVQALGADLRIGYLAIVAEYLPFVFHQHNLLELKPFQASLKEKVAARRAKRKKQAA